MRPTIDQIRTAGDYARMYTWDLTIVKFPAAGAPYPSSDDLNIRCLSSEVPKMTGTSIEVNIRGHRIRQPGIYNYNTPITFTFVETVDGMVNDFFKRWRDACWATKTGRAAPKSDLEGTIILHLLDTNDNAIWQYKLIGCFLEDYDPTGGPLGGDTSDVLRPSLMLSYDYFEDTKLV